MHTVTPPRRDNHTVVVPLPPARMPRVKHSGAGTHGDRRTKRQGTRAARFRLALRD